MPPLIYSNKQGSLIGSTLKAQCLPQWMGGSQTSSAGTYWNLGSISFQQEKGRASKPKDWGAKEGPVLSPVARGVWILHRGDRYLRRWSWASLLKFQSRPCQPSTTRIAPTRFFITTTIWRNREERRPILHRRFIAKMSNRNLAWSPLLFLKNLT